ncbi:UNVERIFIED_CONTAM: hypothetical protein FKN15_010910, partial [Acipenser sinensis]
VTPLRCAVFRVVTPLRCAVFRVVTPLRCAVFRVVTPLRCAVFRVVTPLRCAVFRVVTPLRCAVFRVVTPLRCAVFRVVTPLRCAVFRVVTPLRCAVFRVVTPLRCAVFRVVTPLRCAVFRVVTPLRCAVFRVVTPLRCAVFRVVTPLRCAVFRVVTPLRCAVFRVVTPLRCAVFRVVTPLRCAVFRVVTPLRCAVFRVVTPLRCAVFRVVTPLRCAVFRVVTPLRCAVFRVVTPLRCAVFRVVTPLRCAVFRVVTPLRCAVFRVVTPLRCAVFRVVTPLRCAVFRVVDAAVHSEVVLLKVPGVPGDRLVFAPTGPLDRDYDDVRRFTDAAVAGMKRALKAGMQSPLLVCPAHSTFKESTLVSVLGALHALYVDASNVCGLLSNRVVCRDIGGSDPERMAAPLVVKYVEELFNNTPIKALLEVAPELFTIATLTGHAIRAMGPNYSCLLAIVNAGDELGDVFEISNVRREDFDFHRGKSEYEDILQCNNLPSSATPRGHQTPAAFLIMASGLDQHGVDSEKPLRYSHIDIAGSSGPFPGIPTGAPILAMATNYILHRL